MYFQIPTKHTKYKSYNATVPENSDSLDAKLEYPYHYLENE